MALDPAACARLHDDLRDLAGADEVDGFVWGVTHDGDIHIGAWGTVTPDGRSAARDTIFRISSLTKPIVATAAMALVDRGELGIGDAIEQWLPEVADAVVLRAPTGPLDDTEPLARPITVEDVLTFRLGWGMDFDFARPQPSHDAIAAASGSAGPPAPQAMPSPDDWIAALGKIPLARQPGERWLYNTGAELLGVLLARVTGQSLEELLHDLVLGPAGMMDTGFWIPPDQLERFGTCWTLDPETGTKVVYDAVDGQWSSPPPFASGGGGLVSTVDDLLDFASALAEGDLLSPAALRAMVTNHLTPAQITEAPDPTGAVGWGYGLGVRVERTAGSPESVGTYGWDGGLGSVWRTDPVAGVSSVLLTTQMWTAPEPPAMARALTAGAHGLISDG